jgi:hypothetical protein
MVPEGIPTHCAVARRVVVLQKRFFITRGEGEKLTQSEMRVGGKREKWWQTGECGEIYVVRQHGSIDFSFGRSNRAHVNTDTSLLVWRLSSKAGAMIISKS